MKGHIYLGIQDRLSFQNFSKFEKTLWLLMHFDMNKCWISLGHSIRYHNRMTVYVWNFYDHLTCAKSDIKSCKIAKVIHIMLLFIINLLFLRAAVKLVKLVLLRFILDSFNEIFVLYPFIGYLVQQQESPDVLIKLIK